MHFVVTKPTLLIDAETPANVLFEKVFCFWPAKNVSHQQGNMCNFLALNHIHDTLTLLGRLA